VRNVANWFTARGLQPDVDELIERLLYEAGLR
jgi:RIO kinase 1